ncbi:PREDICTED: transcription repressor OFP7-like [Ipomoea nil]|uniref:transcription repressor OFP7-like n=1 Tax=Ipomoea nil TaxID=35883 RepID=UPI000900E876|nr:PREDICTED: transcription repressor OFP7-like [Ipomoea nil]
MSIYEGILVILLILFSSPMSFPISGDDFFLLRRAIKSKKVKATAIGQCITVSSSSGYENRIDEASRTFRSSASSNDEVLARLSVFKQLILCSVEGKVKESFPIVKTSKDPYEDFKGSMVEMILEKQMFEKHDLEQLLQCFLSLNTRQYHGMIVEVFWISSFSGRFERSTSEKKRSRRRK